MHTSGSYRKWDLFISHAHEDKEEIARPLAHLLDGLGLKVWFDEWELKVGSSLNEAINEGLRQSRYGVVLLTEAYMRSKWTRNELNALFAQETDTNRKILPVRHNVTQAEVESFNAVLADRINLTTVEPLPVLADALASAIGVSFRHHDTEGFIGMWTGLSGRLRLEQHGRSVIGDYDWFGQRWVGQLRGKAKPNVYHFQWQWALNDSHGSGFFLPAKVSQRGLPVHHLVGGWTYSEDDRILDHAIDTYQRYLEVAGEYHTNPEWVPHDDHSLKALKPWSFSRGWLY